MLSSMRDLCDRVAALRAEGLGRTAIVEKAGNEGWATKQDVFGAYWLLQSDFDLEETEALERDVETTALKADVQKYKRENKALKLKANKVDRLVEAYSRSRPPREPIPPKEIKSEGHKQVLITCSGDEHISAMLEYERLHGLNQYNLGIARRRMLYTAELAGAYVMHYWKEKNITRIVDINFGDKFQGTIHDAEATNECEQSDAVIHWLNTKTDCYDMILRQCPHVRITSVHLTGNHSRRSKDRDVDRPKNHDDYLSAKFLERDFRNEPRVEFVVPNSYWQTLNINGHAFICTHGQFIKSWAGIPFYGIMRYYKAMTGIMERTDEYQSMLINSVKALIQKHGDDLTLDDYAPIKRHWIQGHFHTCCAGIDTEYGEIFMNGSLIGPEDFGLSLGAASSAKQLFIAVHPDRVTDRAPIDLSHIRDPRLQKPLEVLEPITVMA